jgi:hypothetical protein
MSDYSEQPLKQLTEYNARLWEQLDPILSELSPSLNSRIRKIAFEHVRSELSAVSSPDWVARHARRLQEKYHLSGNG